MRVSEGFGDRSSSDTGPGGSGRLNVKRLPWPGCAVDPDLTRVLLDEPLGDCQPEPGSFLHRRCRRDLIKLVKDRVLIFAGNPDTIVGNGEADLPAAMQLQRDRHDHPVE